MRFATPLLFACLAVAAEYHGQVKFAGLPLPGVSVTATQHGKSVSAITDQQGVYSFPDLAEGDWSLHVEKSGFSPIEQNVTVGNGVQVPPFELKMLPLDQMQTVAAPPPAAARPAAPVAPPPPSSSKIAPPPPNPPAPFQRTALTPSATVAAPAPAADPAPQISDELSVRAADGFLINGSAINGNASAYAQPMAFGNNRRAGRRLYTYAIALVDSNAALNAANYSLTGQQTVKPPFNNLTGTLSFGGPLIIPHLLPRGGPQLTVNYSRTENRRSSVITSVMPDAAERAGDFSQAFIRGVPVTVTDPLDGAPFPGNVIPADRISPQAATLLGYYPTPNFEGVNDYNYQIPLIGNTHTDNLRIGASQSFKRKNAVNGLFGISDTRSDSDNTFQFLDRTHSLGINSSASYRRTFTPRSFGQLTYSFSRQSTHVYPFFAGRQNVSGLAGITGNDQDPLNWGPPSLGFTQSSIGGLNDSNASLLHNQTSALAYQGSWNRRKHYITYGADERWQQYNTISQNNPRGTFTFSGTATGFDFADFLLGIPDASAIAFGNADKYLRATQPDLYFRDNWNFAPGITFDLGLRWEYTSPETEKYGRLVNLDIAPGFTAISPVLGRDPIGSLTGQRYPASLLRPDYHEIEPIVGVAWRPMAASTLVLRAGYSIRYNTQVYQPFVGQMEQQSPLSTSLSMANSAANPLTLAHGFYAPPNLTTNTIAVDPNLKIGQAQNWYFTVQRDLPAALQMNATYNGTKGTHQLQAFAPNTYPTGPVSPFGYTYYTSYANSEREAATLQLRRRMHNGLLAQLQYTYSKSIDDASALGSGTGTVAQNWLDLRGERGPSTFDQRRVGSLTLQYTSGMGLGGGTLLSGWRGRAIKDWTFLSTINLATGLPLTPIYGSLVPGTGIQGSARASYTGEPLYATPPGYYVNPAAVTAPAPGQWGNAGIGSITGPGQFSVNASMQRAFRLSERVTLNFRLDSNNPLNHVAVTGINTLVTSSLFGLPATVNGMRTVTTTMRLTF